jgi:2-dehydropantoate 2-reductase
VEIHLSGIQAYERELSAMRSGIIGCGPIGGTLAALLTRAGQEVVIVDQDPAIVAAVRSRGLEVTGPVCRQFGGQVTGRPVDVVGDPSDAPAVDVWFVCTKVTSLERVCRQLRPWWREGTPVVSVQNGIDPEEALAEVGGRDHTLRMVVNFAGRAERPGVFCIHWCMPPSFVGSLTHAGQAHARAVGRLLSTAGLDVQVVDDIKQRAFEKTALNASMGPPCTLTGLTMGEVMTRPETRGMVVGLLEESVAVGRGLGFVFEGSIGDYVQYLEQGGKHRTSMHDDLVSGRRTEVGFMNGKIVEYGARVGVPTPYNHAMATLVQGKEEGVRLTSCQLN